MKTVKTLLVFIPILLVLGVGFMMPNIVLSFQDNDLELQETKYEMNSVKFDATAFGNIVDKLILLESDFEMVFLDNGKELDAKGAYESALTVVGMLINNNLISTSIDDYTSHDETPLLLLGNGGEEAAIFWQCYMENEKSGERIILTVDDETGKMVSFTYAQAYTSTVINSIGFVSAASEWADMCMDYFGFKSYEIETEDFDGYVAITFYLVDSEGQTVDIDLTIEYSRNGAHLVLSP